MEHQDEFIVIKAGNEKNILDLYENGTIYCNTLVYFKEFEDGQVRRDVNEGLGRLTNIKKEQFVKVEMQWKDNILPPREIHPLSLQLRERLPSLHLNLYCLYSVRVSAINQESNFSVHRRLKEFGSHFLIFTDTRAFVERIEFQLKTRNYIFWRNSVTYYDLQNHSGELDHFHKSKEYEWQSEFRFLIRNNESKPLIIKIGSVKDIAVIGETSSL